MGDGAEHVCDSVDDLVDEHLAELEIIAMVARSMMTASLSINDHVSLCWARRMTGSGRSMNGAETAVGYINNLAVSTTHCRAGSCVSFIAMQMNELMMVGGSAMGTSACTRSSRPSNRTSTA